jgi:hypothetical protein
MATHDFWANHLAYLLPLDGVNDYKPDQSAVPEELKKKVRQLLGIVAWTVTACCIVGVLAVAMKMAVNHGRGEGGQHFSGLGMVGLACVLGSSAGPLVMAIF